MLVTGRKTKCSLKNKFTFSGVEAHAWQGKARGRRIAGYLTNEQHNHAGWIGASKCEVIFERTLRKEGKGGRKL